MSDYFTKLRAGTAHEKYDPSVEGFGNEAQWTRLFNMAMGFEEAQEFRREQQKKGRRWNSEVHIIADMAGVDLAEDAVWSAIKSAFRKATMNCHPDRSAVHGKPKVQADEEFKEISAAFVILKHQRGEN